MIQSLLLVASAFGHFYLHEPTPRTVVDATEKDAPCGGSALGSRTIVRGTQLQLKTQAFHKDAKFTYKLSLKENPTSNEDFPHVVAPEFVVQQTGNISTTLNFQNIPIEKYGTVQVYSLDGPSGTYQCVDLEFQKVASSAQGLTWGGLLAFVVTLLQ
jgi:hypothetical protein